MRHLNDQAAVTLQAEPLPAELQPHRGKAAGAQSRDDWQTPPEFLAGLGQRWRFVLDAACSLDNAVAEHGLTPGLDGLAAPWLVRAANRTHAQAKAPAPGARDAVWCNPPYGRKGELSRAFVAKGAQEAYAACGSALDVVMLLAATPDVRWFHDVALSDDLGCSEVWFTRGRLAFVNPSTGQPARNNGGGSVLLVWRAGWRRPGAPFLGSLGRDGLPAGKGGW